MIIFIAADSVAYTGSVFGAGTGPAIYSDFDCGGWEPSLLQCDKKSYPDIYCTPDDTAGALCTSVCNDGDVRLVGGNNDHEGTVEICYNSIWGMVSDLNWGASDARVVCRQLNLGTDGWSCYSGDYSSIIIIIISDFVFIDVGAIVGSYFSRPDDAVHITNVGCFGDEMTLDACASTKIDIGDAQLYQMVAGVTCLARSFNPSATSYSSVSKSSEVPVTTEPLTSSDTKSVVQNTVIILGVVVLIALVGVVM